MAVKANPLYEIHNGEILIIRNGIKTLGSFSINHVRI